MAISTPHDLLFTRAFDDPEVGRAELERVLPAEVLALIDLGSLTLEPTRLIDGALSKREGDVCYRAKLVDGLDAFIWLIFEHQSLDQVLMGLRLLEYMVRRWSVHASASDPAPTRLPLIVPVVVSHAPGGWRSARRFRDLYAAPREVVEVLEPVLVDFTFLVDDLTATTDEEIARRSTSVLLTLVLWSLRSRGRVDRAQKGVWAEHLRRLYLERGTDAVEPILSYHVEVSEDEVPVVIEAAREAHPELERTCMTYAERLKQQGVDKGERRGKVSVLLKLVELKFGAQPAELAARVEALSPAELEHAIERILTATSVDAVFGG